MSLSCGRDSTLIERYPPTDHVTVETTGGGWTVCISLFLMMILIENNAGEQ